MNFPQYLYSAPVAEMYNKPNRSLMQRLCVLGRYGAIEIELLLLLFLFKVDCYGTPKSSIFSIRFHIQTAAQSS